jgi:mRNA-degrading endonuclease RelE of RelBE toxin-antitoxin system
MATETDFQIDSRVAIAMDALTASQKAALKSVLRSKESFVAHATGPGRSKKLSSTKPLYKMRVGHGLRVFYSIVDDNIVVLDVMRKATMDRLGTKRKSKAPSVKKGLDDVPVNRDEAIKAQKS